MPGEAVTLQLGHYAGCVGAHWWGLQVWGGAGAAGGDERDWGGGGCGPGAGRQGVTSGSGAAGCAGRERGGRG